MDNRSFNKFLKVSISVVVILSIIMIAFVYNVKYRVKLIDTSSSSKGDYTVELKSIGEPEFPFGMTSGKIVLKKDGNKISEKEFKIADDGAFLSKHNWLVKWSDKSVKIYLRASEQGDMLYDMQYNGKVISRNNVDDIKEKIKNEYRFSNDYVDNEKYEQESEKERKKEEEKLEKEYIKLFEYLKEKEIVKISSEKPKFLYNAKGEMYIRLSEDEETRDGETVVITYTAVLNNNGGDDSSDEFVLYKNRLAKDGVNIESTEILGFYMVNKANMNVKDEKRSSW